MGEQASEWNIQRGGRIRRVDELTLRARLRRGRYTGAELVRQDGAGEWVRLYQLPLYREEVPAGTDPLLKAKLRLAQPMLVHLLVFSVVVGVQHGTPPIWALFWGLGLLMHILRTAGEVRALRGAPLPTTPPASLPEAPVTPTRVAAPARSPWRARVEEALVALEAAASGSASSLILPDLAAIRADADALDRASVELAPLAGDRPRERLQTELSEAERQRAASTDPATQAAFGEAIAAIRERLSSVEQAAEVASRLEARKLTLLHQLESARLAIASSQGDEAGSAALVGRVQELRARAEAGRALESELELARRARARVGAG